MLDIENTLVVLAQRRMLFHSEADFQHAFAWELHKLLPDASIRLEFPMLLGKRAIHLDIWATDGAQNLAIELKYKTRALSVSAQSEPFSLKDQSAQDTGRYDFIKDVYRLEQIVTQHTNTRAYAVFLTNDSAYWTPAREPHTVDADFRISAGRSLQGEMKWGVGASAGTRRGREEPLVLQGSYPITWADYAEPSSATYGKFRYAVVALRV